MKTRTISAAALAVAVLALQPAYSQEMKAKPASDAAPMMTIDRDTFLKMVGSSNVWEIESSKLAQDNAKAADLKDTANMIVADHQKASDKLKMTLEGKGGAAPAPELNVKHRKMLDQLQAAKGSDFDMLYLDMQAQAHMEAVASFRTYAGAGDDQELVGFAKDTLPSLETHLGHVKMLIAKM
jgi:putative membrane protein